jgi:hypothetical protein
MKMFLSTCLRHVKHKNWTSEEVDFIHCVSTGSRPLIQSSEFFIKVVVPLTFIVGSSQVTSDLLLELFSVWKSLLAV